MPKLSEAQAEVRRQQILRAMFNCLAKIGYARVTMRDIAKEAGVSVGTLYLYFSDKEAIIAALQQESDNRVEVDLEKPKGQRPSDRLRSVLEYHLMELDEPGVEATLRVDVQLWAEAVHHDGLGALARKVLGQKTQSFAELISAAQADGDLPGTWQPEPMARLLVALIAGMELQKALQPDLAMAPLISLLRSFGPGPESDISAPG